MTAVLVVALVIMAVIVAVGLVVLVILLRDAWRNRAEDPKDDWEAVHGDDERWETGRGVADRGLLERRRLRRKRLRWRS